MRLLLITALAVLSVACGGGSLQNLSLQWRGVDGPPKPSAAVAASLGAVPISFGLRDVRHDPTAVGTDTESGTVVRTADNVAQYCSARLGEILRSAGARLDEAPMAGIETDLLEYKVDEGGTFSGLVQLRVVVRRAGSPDWAKVYQGTSKRWGRSHNPENWNEALSNALVDAAGSMVTDDAFARALMAEAAPAEAAPPPPGN